MRKISIVIPLYNKRDTILQTIESIRRQTYQHFEIVVIDDGSTDGSAEIVEKIVDSRIRLIRQQNAGVSVARNRGIKESHGEYIAFIDADDEWCPAYLETQNELISLYPTCSIFSTGYAYKNENEILKDSIINGIRFSESHGVLDNYFEVASKSNPPLWTSAVVVKKSALIKVGGFPIGVSTGEDLMTWAKLACFYKIAYRKQSLAIYYSPTNGTLRADPKDMSLQNDVIGYELSKLLREKKPFGWNLYLSFWFKMRAIINLKKCERKESIRYSIMALKYNILNGKAIISLILSIAPKSIIFKLLKGK